MPVIRQANRKNAIATLREHLTDLLVKELMGERGRMGPVIFELPTQRADQVDVIVVWEAWESLPIEERSHVVRDAYRRFSRMMEATFETTDPGKSREHLVSMPGSVLCASWEDLTESDLLPFKVYPKTPDKVNFENMRLLMIELGASWTAFGVQLRFPNKEMATDVYHQLMEEMPEAGWTIVESSFGPIME